jgi:hypothetical protein
MIIILLNHATRKANNVFSHLVLYKHLVENKAPAPFSTDIESNQEDF